MSGAATVLLVAGGLYASLWLAKTVLVRHAGRGARRLIEGVASEHTQLVPMDENSEQRLITQVASVHGWAEANGFKFVGTFALKAPNHPGGDCVIWEQREHGRLLVAGVSGKPFLDLVTHFNDGVMLSTGRYSGGLFGPDAPNEYRQSFSGMELPEMWNRHENEERYMVATWNVRHNPLTNSAEMTVCDSSRRFARHLLAQLTSDVLVVRWANAAEKRMGVPVRDQGVRPPRIAAGSAKGLP